MTAAFSRMGLDRRAWRGSARRAVALAAVLVLLVLLFVPTSAAAPRSWNGFIGGGAAVNTGGLFTQPHDVAVYTADTPTTADDKIFVVEQGGNSERVSRLDSDGNFELAWGRDVVRPGAAGNTGTGAEICDVSTNGSAGCQGGAAGSSEGEFSGPSGIAVAQSSGRVFVVDSGNRRVQEFNLDGDFVGTWGWGVASGVDSFQVCVSGCQAGITVGGGAQAGQFADASINSIDVSPVAPHDVFVTDAGNRRLLQFSVTGDLLRGWGWGVDNGGDELQTCTAVSGCQAGNTSGAAERFAGTTPANSWPRHIAVDADGVAYASDASDSHRVIRIDTDSPPPPPTVTSLLVPLPAAGLLGAGQTSGMEVDPATGNLLIGRDRSVFGGDALAAIQEISDPGAELPPGGPPTPALVDTHVLADEGDAAGGEATRSIGVDPSNGNIYVAVPGLVPAERTGGAFTGCANVFVCTGLAVLDLTSGPLSAAMGAPTQVDATAALLEGSVNPGGGLAKYRFQVSSDGASWRDASDSALVAGSTDRVVSAEVSGLEPATLYRARLAVAKQTDIAATESVETAESLFLTDAAPPVVQTLGSSRRTESSVRLRGTVDPSGSNTSYRFEYGLAGGSFDRHVPIPDADAGAGNTAQAVAQDVGDLLPGTIYQYRIVAESFVGQAIGNTITFTTREQTAPAPAPPGRGYELVSPADKIAGVGAGVWFHGPAASGVAGFPAHTAERFAVQGTMGSVLVDGEFAYANDWALAERTPNGWTHLPAASRRAHGAQAVTFLRLAAAAPDLSLTGWGSNGHWLKLFPEMESWLDTDEALLLRDWTDGKWEVMGPLDPDSGGGLSDVPVVASDGRSAVATGTVRGLAGPDDPTLDLAFGRRSVYVDEIPNGLSDTFPGEGNREVVNVCTPGTEIPSRVDVGGTFKQASQPCPPPEAGRDAALVSDGGAATGRRRDMVSEDGSRIFFLSPEPGLTGACSGVGTASACPAQLYVRQRDGDGDVVTRWISRTEIGAANGASADQDASLMGPVFFEGASSDGDKVFFRTASPLTADDRNGEGAAPPAGGIVTGAPSQSSWDLYMYDFPDAPEADPAEGDLIRISAGPNGDGDCNSPLQGNNGNGALRFASEDGARLLFTCAAPLPGVPLADSGTTTSPGGLSTEDDAANLYAYDAARPPAQAWRFVANLPMQTTFGSCAATGTNEGMPLAPSNDQGSIVDVFGSINCVHGAPDGGLVTFWTDGQLTEDDPDGVSADLYAYDIVHDELTRISSPQGGVGGTYACAVGASGAPCYADGGIGLSTGAMPLRRLGIATDPSSGVRSVFFQSRSRLIAADTDTRYDVYRWREGELSLLSTGVTAAHDAFFMGNDHSGLNVYLATRDRLTWQDHDAVLDVYTARVGGGFDQPDGGEACDVALDQCQAPGQAQQPTPIETDSPLAGNGPDPVRLKLGLSVKTRRAARTGRMAATVTASGPATVTVTVRARLAGKVRRAAGIAVRRLPQSGDAKATLRLTRQARRQLRNRKRLAITVTARSPGARPATRVVVLER